MKPAARKRTYFVYFLLFNLCFLGLQAAYLYLQNGSFANELIC